MSNSRTSRRFFKQGAICLALGVWACSVQQPVFEQTGLRAYVANPAVLSLQQATASVNAASAGRAIDQNTDTHWNSGQVSNPFWRAGLAEQLELTELRIKVNPAGSYAVDVSLDGSSWRTVSTGVKNTTWNLETKRMPANTLARMIRLRFANSGRSVMLFEVVAVGGRTATTSPVPTVSPSPVVSVMPSADVSPVVTPTPVATSTPVPQPTATVVPTPAGNRPTIVVDTGRVLHKAVSQILGTNRNHVTGDFPNGAAKLVKMRELTPQWGDRKYLYRIGHGPTDGRYDYDYMTGFHFESCWNVTTQYPYDDIREGLKEAAAMGAYQFHTVNYGTSTPEEAGRYVSYLNRANDANRAKYPMPLQQVTEFELGNEIPWDRVRGHDQYAPNESVYAQRALLFAKQMRASSDTPIKIGAVASINSNWMGNGWSGGATTVKNILQIMGSEVDFLTFHGYPSWPLYQSGNLLTIMAQNEWNRNKIENEIKPAIKQYGGGRPIYISNTEFFTHLYSDVTRSRGLFGALYAADSVILAFNLDLRAAVEFCFDHKEMGDAAFFFKNDPQNVTAIFKFQKMLAQHWGDDIVATAGSAIPAVAVKGASTSVTMPKLAFSAAQTGNKVYVMVVHRTNDADLNADIQVGFTPSSATAYVLSAPNGFDAANGDVTTITNPSLSGFTFRKASITLLELTR